MVVYAYMKHRVEAIRYENSLSEKKNLKNALKLLKS